MLEEIYNKIIFEEQYPTLFKKLCEHIKPYVNARNTKEDIYDVFKLIADTCSLDEVLVSKNGNDILDISDMEDYFKLTSRENWIFDLFEEVYAFLTRSSGDLL
jgi:hypothetical protein